MEAWLEKNVRFFIIVFYCLLFTYNVYSTWPRYFLFGAKFSPSFKKTISHKKVGKMSFNFGNSIVMFCTWIVDFYHQRLSNYQVLYVENVERVPWKSFSIKETQKYFFFCTQLQPADEDATLTPAMKDYLKKRSAAAAAAAAASASPTLNPPSSSSTPRRPDDSNLLSL